MGIGRSPDKPNWKITVIALAALSFALPAWAASSVGKSAHVCSGKTLVGRVAAHANDENNAQQEFNSALAAFNGGRFGEAVDRLEKLQNSGFCPDAVHYYLALSYQDCDQVVPAQIHYKWVETHSKNQLLRKYSRCGYDTLAYYSSHRTYEGQPNHLDAKIQKNSDSTAIAASNCNPDSTIRRAPDGQPILQWSYDGLPG
ncbi:MAG TPA: hypothetical protein V6C69_04105 [Trichormus sp.]|jgi:hypothetical protein